MVDFGVGSHRQASDRQQPCSDLDGVCALDVVDQIKRKADFLIFLRGGDEGSSLAPQILAYRSRRRPDQLAQFTLEGYVE